MGITLVADEGNNNNFINYIWCINNSTTQTNLFTNARKAKSTAKNAQIDENTTLTKYENQIVEITGNRDTVTIDKEFYTLLKNNKYIYR